VDLGPTSWSRCWRSWGRCCASCRRRWANHGAPVWLRSAEDSGAERWLKLGTVVVILIAKILVNWRQGPADPAGSLSHSHPSRVLGGAWRPLYLRKIEHQPRKQGRWEPGARGHRCCWCRWPCADPLRSPLAATCRRPPGGAHRHTAKGDGLLHQVGLAANLPRSPCGGGAPCHRRRHGCRP
jgi:hypothetical protein